MSATSEVQKSQKEEITDDISQDNSIDLNKLAALRAKQENKMAAKIVAKKERSLNFGIIGTGQGGSRIAESFFKLNYETIVINTCLADLKFIEIPDSNKLLLDNGIGGSAKEIELGRAAAENNRGEILQLINEKLSASQVNVLCLSLGGGSGAGSCETLVDILSSLEKPLIVIATLPMDSDDVKTKSNSLETLSKLTMFAKSKKISNLIVVDNAKIESIYKDVSQFDFFDLANKAIVNTLDVFNTLSCVASSVKTLDSMEWSKILMDGGGLSVYGEFSVDNYTEDTAIAESIVNSLSGNLLAQGFNLADAKYVGFMICANKNVWSKIPASSINYASAMVTDVATGAQGIFKGVYTTDIPEDVVKVYSFFSGLGLPNERIDGLKKETAELQSKVKVKDEQRNLNLQLDTGKNETVSAAQKVKDKIAAKSSIFGKFTSGTIDRRK